MKINQFTKDAAIDYANTEAELRGFEIGSEQWKKAFRKYVEDAVGTMSLGRNPRTNPRTSQFKVYTELYPDVFGSQGFAGKVARAYRSKSEQPVELEEVQNRILSSVVNLSKLFENGIANAKTTTRGTRQGAIPNDAKSDYQFPKKPPGISDEDWSEEIVATVYNWFMRDAVMNCVLESLNMFWSMSKSDIAQVMDIVKIKALMGKDQELPETQAEQKSLMESIQEQRKRWIVILQGRVNPATRVLNFAKLATKKSE